jgi:hypothetical protein
MISDKRWLSDGGTVVVVVIGLERGLGVAEFCLEIGMKEWILTIRSILIDRGRSIYDVGCTSTV